MNMRFLWPILVVVCLAQLAAAGVTWRQVFEEACRVERAYKDQHDDCRDGQVRGRLHEEYLSKVATREHLGSKLGVAECEPELEGLAESLEGVPNRCAELREILNEKCRSEAMYSFRFNKMADTYTSYRLASAKRDRQVICNKTLNECCSPQWLELGEQEARR